MWKVVLAPYYWKHMIHTQIKESFEDSKGWLGKIAWFDTMIHGGGSVYVDLLVTVTHA